MLRRSAVGPIADHQQLRPDFPSHRREHAHHVQHPLHRPEVRQVYQNLLPSSRIPRPRRRVRIPPVQVAVDEVVDDTNLVGHPEHRPRPLLQVAADSSHPVALLDRELHDGQVRPIRSHQRNVGPVQRGDKRQPSAQHLLGQQGADGVRNRVVHVQQIQARRLGHLRHAGRQRQAIRRIEEQRIGRDLHLVVVNPGVIGIQADGVGVTDEVNFMPPRRQLHAQLGSNNAAAAVGGVTGDADVHGSRKTEGRIQKAEYRRQKTEYRRMAPVARSSVSCLPPSSASAPSDTPATPCRSSPSQSRGRG